MKELKKEIPANCKCNKVPALYTYETFSGQTFFKVVCRCGNSGCSYDSIQGALNEWKHINKLKAK